jgi:hypothetical protein
LIIVTVARMCATCIAIDIEHVTTKTRHAARFTCAREEVSRKGAKPSRKDAK